MTIGSEGADMVVDDPQLDPIHLQITLEKNAFTIVNLNPQKKAMINGKALKGKPLPFKSNDNISVGSTTIFFMKVDAQPIQPPAPFESEANLERLMDSESALGAVWESMNILIQEFREKAGGASSTSGSADSPPPGPGVGPPPLPKG